MTHLPNAWKTCCHWLPVFLFFGSMSQYYEATQNTFLSILSWFAKRIHIRRIIKEHAVYEKRSTYRRCCWYVHPDVLARHSQEALPVPCQWTYLTSGTQITRDEHAGSQGNSPTMSSSSTPSNKRKSTSSHSITKYMKKCGDSEQVQCQKTFLFFFAYCLLVFC